jgi:hypothetical protein
MIRTERLPRLTLAQKILQVYACPLHPNITSYKPDVCPLCGLNLEIVKPLWGKIYSCPIHPDIRTDHPDICPKCGLRLVQSDVVTSRYRR